ncbi:hypothetical protein FGO68_gene17315 [Halteria grandinella]|uniref:Uncharacterized protein n=1 Tax=Halteria grandinella TaxID=5974 RepID=A0A8J8NPQ1_HALGN|nr:hypothetical protein FGO68_gene17315 [Halteria grandinella]
MVPYSIITAPIQSKLNFHSIAVFEMHIEPKIFNGPLLRLRQAIGHQVMLRHILIECYRIECQRSIF